MNPAKKQSGFSLVELMAVVAIITVLSALTLPRYRAFVARSRMGEAKVNLLHIASLQALYRSENSQYFDGLSVGNVGGTEKCDPDNDLRNELGYQPDDCTGLRYGYTTTGGASTFSGTARYSGSPASKQIYPQCSEEDKWTNSNSQKPKHDAAENAVKECE